MARALQDILSELNSVYDPQRQVYNQQITALDPQQQAEEKGLEAAKQDSFQQITDQANRRGLFYSGIPLAEQQKYTGATYLPAVANLKARYAQQRFNLQDALAQITKDQQLKGEDIYQTELSRDEAARQAAAARAASGGSGGGSASPTFGFGGGGGGAAPAPAPSQTLRQRWQAEAKAGDWNAQVALNYAGDDGRYDGPVNSQDEYNRLKSMGIAGNYYVAQRKAGGGGGGGGW